MSEAVTQVAEEARPSGSDAPLLEVSGLSVEFEGRDRTTRAVDGVDLAIKRGEIVAVVGESGSGKTLTALSIARILPRGARVIGGSIALDGEDLLALSDREMNRIRGGRIGMLFQNPRASLDPTSKVGLQVGEPYRLHRGASSREAWDRSIELLADVGIPEPERRASSYAHQLSGGMAQRVMVAMALAGEPDLLIADEPTTALDVTIQAQVLHLLLETRKTRGLSILFITHDLAIVPSIADSVSVMYAGRVVESGPAGGVIAKGRHPYTDALLRSSKLTREPNGRLFAIPGYPPQPGEAARGCPFRPRCQVADSLGIAEECESMEPVLTECGDDPKHRARCWGLGPRRLLDTSSNV